MQVDRLNATAALPVARPSAVNGLGLARFFPQDEGHRFALEHPM